MERPDPIASAPELPPRKRLRRSRVGAALGLGLVLGACGHPVVILTPPSSAPDGQPSRIVTATPFVQVETLARPVSIAGGSDPASRARTPRRDVGDSAAAADAALVDIGERIESRPRALGAPYQDLRRHTHRGVGEDTGIDVSPDGGAIIYSSTQDDDAPKIYLEEASSTLVRAITTGRSRDIQPKFSPDGLSIGFASDREGNFDVWLVPLARPSTLEQLTSTPEDEVHPTFSPDGKRIAYCRLSSRGGWSLWMRDRDVDRYVELGPGLFPEWSPTGEWIAFQRPSDRDRRWFGIWAVRPDGSDLRQIVAYDDRGAIQPAWSPRGDRIAFTTSFFRALAAESPADAEDAVGGDASIAIARVASDTGRGSDISILDLADGRTFRLTWHGGSNASPAWGLDGRIYFSSDRYGGRNILSLLPPEAGPR